MKYLLITIAILIGIGLQAQSTLYKLHFKVEQIELMAELDSIKGVNVRVVKASIVGWEYSGNDSTAIYAKGYFYDVLSKTELPQLDKNIIDPYPDKFNHAFAGRNESNTIFKRKP